MSSDITDDFKPGMQLEPLRGYEDLADILDPVTGRLIGRFGERGMKIEEAAVKAEAWWNAKGRQQMPDYGKSDQYLNDYGVRSGILIGLPWAKLNRGERIRVVKVWHHEIGIPHGLGINNEMELKNVLEQEKIRRYDLARIIGGDPAERDTGSGRAGGGILLN